MAKFMVACLVALVLSMSLVNAQIDCASVFAGMFPCTNYLSSFVPITPGLQCCTAASNVVSLADTDSLCQCFTLNPLGSGYLASKAQQLPGLCNLTSFLPLVKCMINPSGGDSPMIPVPPLFALPPVLPEPPMA